MAPTLLVVVALSVLVGLSLGLLGGGGSILMVPLLGYVGGLEPREAMATSLFVVGVTSATSLVGHARGGNVRWRAGLLFGSGGMAGAFLGGLAGGHVPGTVSMIAFALVMIAAAFAMIRGRKGGRVREAGHPRQEPHPLGRTLMYGLVVGSVTGMVGAGGGFLVVPALTLVAGLPMAAAVGTSLLVITMNSGSGLSGYLTSVSLDWPLVAAVTTAAVLGSMVGVRLIPRVPEAALRRAFGYLVLLMGSGVLALELPSPLALALVGSVSVAGAAALACRLAADRCPLRAAAPAGGVVTGG